MRDIIENQYGWLMYSISQCEKALKSTLLECRGREEWAGQRGGYLCIADGINGLPLVTVLMGEVSLQKAPKYLEFCQEKAARLAGHRDHESSYESRNPGKDRWGGAVRCGNKIFSFSGLPELGDEAVMLKAALLSNTPIEVLERIAQRSNNPYWAAVRQL